MTTTDTSTTPEKKKAGRPPKYGTPMDAPTRSRLYRSNRARAASVAGDDLAKATDRQLLDRLNHLLGRVVTDPGCGLQSLAASTWRELAVRYGLV